MDSQKGHMLTNKQIAKIRKGLNGVDQRVVFKVLGDANRYRVFEILSKQARLTVSDLAKILKISIPLASQHLKILEQASVLEKEKQGQRVYYKLRTDNSVTRSIIKEVL